MVDYRRFVSYIYRYVHGDRGKNVGFVRLEVRNVQCRVQVVMNHLSREDDTTGEVYGFRQEGETVLLAHLGRIMAREGMSAGCFQTRADRFAGTELPVTGFHGIAVFLGEEKDLYVTMWEDVPLKEERLREVEAKEQTSDALGANESAATEDFQFIPLRSSRELPELKEIVVEEESEEESEEEPEEIRKEKTGSEEENPESDMENDKEKPCSQEAAVSNAGDWKQWWKSLLTAGSAVIHRGEDKKEMEEVLPESVPQVTKPLMVDNPEEISSVVTEHKKVPGEVWERLERIYPHLLLPGIPENWQVLRLTWQDLGRLPSHCWPLAQNPFLRYHYEQEPHLILLREENGRIWLGVPSRELNEERLAAELADFRRYLPTRRKGYWLTGIML